MPAPKLVPIFFSIIALALAACGRSPDEASAPQDAIAPADFVFTNARVFTVDEAMPWAEAVAVRGDRFVYVGDAAGAEAYIGPATNQADLGGAFVMPGIIDGHTHPGMLGIDQFDGPRLPRGNKKDLLAAVKTYADSDPGTGWIRMRSWWNGDYLGDGKIGPRKEDLDAVVSDRPVWINSGTWHSAWLNSKALSVLGITKDTPDPATGVADYVRDETGEPTGWVREGAGWQFTAEQFPADVQRVRDGIDDALASLTKHGVTTVFDAGNWDYQDVVFSYLAELEAAGKLPVRYDGSYTVYLPDRRHLAVEEMKRLRQAYGGERLQFRTIKLFMDGITPEIASGVISPLLGYPKMSGATMISVEELRDWLLILHEEEFDLHVHTIGDLSVRRVLDAVEAAQEIVGDDFYPRVTVAHLELIDEADWPRFAELGVSANFTAWWHGRPTSPFGLSLLGAKRASHVFPANALIAAGGNVTFSSDDWEADLFNPFLGIQVGHNRRFPDEWLGEDAAASDTFRGPASEKIDLDEMIKGYTVRAAYPFRLEDEIGTISVGKLADLLVLDTDPFEVHRRSIHKVRPQMVMMEGAVVHGDLSQNGSAKSE